MTETTTFSEYVSVYRILDKLDFSWNLMSSEFIGALSGKDLQGALLIL